METLRARLPSREFPRYFIDQRVKKKKSYYFIDPSIPISLVMEWCFKDLNEGR